MSKATEQDRERARALWWKLWNTPSAGPEDISNEEAVLAEALAAERERALETADDAVCAMMDEHWRLEHMTEYHTLRSVRAAIRALLAAGQPAEGAPSGKEG